MSFCFKRNVYQSITYRLINRRNLFRSFQYSFCAQSTTINQQNEENELEIEIENELEPIDYEWEPEDRYQDFLKFYCSNNDLDDKKWTDIAKKLDTQCGTLQHWIQKISNNMNSDTSNMTIQFAELTDINGEIQKEAEILLCRSNLSMDLYWSPSIGAIPSLQSLILINNEYIACILKHLSTTHLRALIIGKINENLDEFDDTNKASKYILKHFPMIEWEAIHNNNNWRINNESDDDPFDLLNSQNIIALGYRLKIPLINNCILSSGCNQIIELEEDDNFDCSAVDIVDNVDLKQSKVIQSNTGIRQSYYNNYKKKLFTQMMDINDNEDDIVLHKVFPTGIKYIDLLNPLTKHGINIIITPKDKEYNNNDDIDIFKEIARNWCEGNENHTIYADIFDDKMDAVTIRNEIVCDENENGGKLTVIAGNRGDSDWYKLQTAVSAATLSKHDENSSNTLVVYRNGNIFNESINNLQRNICGGLSKLKFEDNDEIGHKPYDWIKKRNKRNKPEATTEFYLNWGIEPVIDGATYVIGLKMDSSQIKDIRIQPTAYFPWSDTVIVLDQNNKLDVTHSSSKVLSEIKYTDLLMNDIKVLNGLRRLYSDHQLLSKINIDNHNKNQCVTLWDNIFNKDDDQYQYYQYKDLLKRLYSELIDKYDYDGNKLLDVQCLDTENVKDSSPFNKNINDNPLVAILDSNGDDILLQKLNKFYEQSRLMMNFNDNNPEILIRSKFDHSGFIKGTKMNLQIELFSDDTFKYGIDIGPHCILFINHKPIKLPIKYGYQKKKEEEEKEEEEDVVNEEEEDIMNAFEQLSKHDGLDEFGLNILRYEKGKVNNRHDFFTMNGDLKQDIYDICMFMFGYDIESNIPFIAQKRVGPDALPISAKRRKKKKKQQILANDENGKSEENIIEMLKRKEFVLVTDNNCDQQITHHTDKQQLLQLNDN